MSSLTSRCKAIAIPRTWRRASVDDPYTLHAARGNHLSLSLGYVRGPALSPRVADTLTFTATWSLYLWIQPLPLASSSL